MVRKVLGDQALIVKRLVFRKIKFVVDFPLIDANPVSVSANYDKVS
ncbi:MAG: hypothetical protein GXO89_12605 [Chlorobi bacterium]|nr:hypothetical protein [Chlorobiota bacterium]